MDVGEATFEQEVIDRSAREPVVVDFWADWCGPCKQLGPVLEDVARERQVALVKVDVDANPGLADRFQVSGIPAVKAFRNGEVVSEFVGARSRSSVEAFLDGITRPPLADSLEDEEVVAALREDDYERAFEILLTRAADPARREEVRATMVELFNELGPSHPLSSAYRRRLAALLY